MSKGFDMLRDYIEHDALCMRRRKCCDFEYELQQEFAALEAENAKLRVLMRDTYDCICEMYKYMDGRYACMDAEDDDAYGPILKRMRDLGIET